MLVPFDEVQSIFQVAHDGLWDFLEDHLATPVFGEDLSAAFVEAKEHDPAFTAVIAPDLRSFLEPFLNWLESRGELPDPEPPWTARKGDGEIVLPKSASRKFLSNFLDQLERLVEPSGESLKIQRFGNQISKSLSEFAMFTAAKLNCVLSYNDCDLDWAKFPGFASWLIVSYDEDESPAGELHIVSNINRIEDSARKDIYGQARRFEKAYLHELGHACTNLDYYFAAEPVNGVVYSRPEHETRAWLYSYVVRAYISSARARMSRLLQKGDNEWK